MVSLPEPMPLHVLTGFLGSGKTTLLRRILRASGTVRTGVLINEFGQAGLDHRIVAHVADASAVVTDGCLCCSVRPELARGLLDLLRRSLAGEVSRFSRIVLETSGLSDPAPIINTVQTHPVLKEYFRVAGVVTTVDAVNGHASADHAEFAKQVAVADTIVVTKTDLASEATARELHRRIRAINALAGIRDARAPDFDPASVLQAARTDIVLTEEPQVALAPHDATSFSMVVAERIDWSAFVTWLSLLLNRHGRAVLRFKAMLNVAGEEAPVLVHGVQHIMHPPEHLDAWSGEDRRSCLVFITRGLDQDAIRASFASFLGFAHQELAAIRIGLA